MSKRRLLVKQVRSLLPWARRLPDLSWITSGMSVSGTLHPRHFEALREIGVRAVVDLRQEDKDDEELLGTFGIRLLHLPAPDHFAPTQEQLATGSEWVAEQLSNGRRTLIHCREGIGRSVVLACCVLTRQGHDLAYTLHLTRKRRWGTALSAPQLDAIEQFATLHRASTPSRGLLEQVQAERLA